MFVTSSCINIVSTIVKEVLLAASDAERDTYIHECQHLHCQARLLLWVDLLTVTVALNPYARAWGK